MNWKNLEGASIADNPCWGGPEPHRHDLQHLLRVLGGEEPDDAFPSPISVSSSATLIDRVISRLIIHNDDNYIAIHKPADLRMDGPHRATVHKLLLYLFPPPSMLHKLMDQGAAANELSRQHRHERLIESIAPLTNTSDLKDDPFRTVHQLDYATSGVLLMGKHRRAAGAACISFQERRAKKTYVAVVTSANSNSNEELPLGKDFIESIPTLPESSLKPWAAGSLEKQYRKKRRRDTDGKDTFNGYMPEHAIFAKWRGYMIKKKKMEDASNKKGRQQNQDDIMSQLIQSTTQHLTAQEVDELLSIGPSWKKVKAHCEHSAKGNICSWPSNIEQMAKEYNQSTAAASAETTADEQTIHHPHHKANANTNEDKTRQPETLASSLPPLFRIQNEGSDSFYICASIGEVGDGRFDVLVDPSVALPSTQSKIPSVLPEMKPSLTRCTVVWRGYANDTTSSTAKEEPQVPVAKVVLSPWTGRRHQLRVHLSRVAGCPILGDVAYTMGTEDRGVVGSRMCLHAKELVIPLIGGQVHTFTANDPFVIDGSSIQIDNFC
ncbi:hypothetical protein ACHAWT_001269 [Skeletonema menzelii]